jgi:hypothetical protein
MRKIAVCIALFALTIGYFVVSQSDSRGAAPAQAAEVLKFEIPIVTHGFARAQSLPDGDVFLLPKPMTMAVSNPPEGAKVFPVNIENFGGDGEMVGALPSVTPQGLSLSSSNSKVRALTCADNLWDGNLLLASAGNTEGDTVRLFLEATDGGPGHELALFTVKGQGIYVAELHQHLMMYVNNRYATGPMWKKGAYIPFSVAAGPQGMRTDLLTISWPMHFFSPLQGCYRIGVEITRGGGQGSTSVVFTDLVVNRNRAPGDESNPGLGLLGRLTGGYPTGLPCKAECPVPSDEIPPPPAPDPQQPGGDACSAICFRSPIYFRLNIGNLPHGVVVIGGMNFNRPISTTDKRAISIALRGGFTPLQKLNQEFVAAQLNVLNAGGEGSPRVVTAMEGKLKCYGMDFAPVTLSNGFTITPETKLKDLFQHCRQCINLNTVEDMLPLATIFDLLNGNDPLNICHLN